MVAYTHMSAARNAVLTALRAAELARLERDKFTQGGPQSWRLPVPPNLPVDTYMQWANDGWLLGGEHE